MIFYTIYVMVLHTQTRMCTVHTCYRCDISRKLILCTVHTSNKARCLTNDSLCLSFSLFLFLYMLPMRCYTIKQTKNDEKRMHIRMLNVLAFIYIQLLPTRCLLCSHFYFIIFIISLPKGRARENRIESRTDVQSHSVKTFNISKIVIYSGDWPIRTLGASNRSQWAVISPEIYVAVNLVRPGSYRLYFRINSNLKYPLKLTYPCKTQLPIFSCFVY